MHPNPAFRGESTRRALACARDRGFGILTIATPEGVLASHIPFLLAEDDAAAEAHLVRSNPIARRLAAGPADALLIVSGADGYISPDWYGEPDRVPTWNYIAIHLRGTVALVPAGDLRAHLDRLAARFEATLAPKPPWTAEKMAPDALARMMRQIVPIRLTGLTVDSTFKLNQNRSTEARERAAAALAAGGTPGQETAALAAAMRALPDG